MSYDIMDKLAEVLEKHELLKTLLDTYWASTAEAVAEDPECIKPEDFCKSVVGSFMDNINDMDKESACETLSELIMELLGMKQTDNRKLLDFIEEHALYMPNHLNWKVTEILGEFGRKYKTLGQWISEELNFNEMDPDEFSFIKLPIDCGCAAACLELLEKTRDATALMADVDTAEVWRVAFEQCEVFWRG